MKKFLKYGLILLTLVGFLTSFIELDTQECKQNYNKETHIYDSSKVETHQVSHLEIVIALPPQNLSFWFASKVLQRAITYISITEPDPPERLYLRHSVFLI